MSTKRKDINELKIMVKTMTNNEYTLNSNEYINQHQKLKFSHKSNGILHEFEMKWKYFQKGCRCTICEKQRKNNMNKKDINWLKLEFNKIKDSHNYLLKSTVYKTNKIKLLFHCKLCNNEFKMTWNDFQQGHRCPNCKKLKQSKEKTHTYNYVKEFIENYGKGDYKLLSNEYIDNEHELEILHKECNKISKRKFKDFQQHKCCKFCIPKSKGELLIETYLLKNKYKFKSQYKIDSLRNILPLPFDFCVFLEEKIKLIEFDGIQHYKVIEKFGGLEEFIKRKHNDNLKDKYCLDNNIELIRIPYFKMNKIDEILDSSLNK